jgi:hypothetical protein
MLITFVAARFRIVISRTLVARIRAELIRKLQVLSIGYFDVRGTADGSLDMGQTRQCEDGCSSVWFCF